MGIVCFSFYDDCVKQSAIAQQRDRRRAQRELPEPADTRRAIVAATERVLAEAPLHEISVGRILVEAGVGRRTFYSYFSSKFDAFTALLEEVMDEFYDVFRPFIDGLGDQAPGIAIGEVIRTSTQLWRKHRAVGRATHEHWQTVPQIGLLWTGFVDRFADAAALEIDRQRAAGTAPPGTDSRQLAAALLWTTEHLLYVAGSPADSAFVDENDVLPTLTAIWTQTLYAQPAH